MDVVKPGVSMRKFMLAVSFGSVAGHLMAFQDSYVTPFGAYRTVVRGGPPPCGAYCPTVTYGPGNRRCVSQLVHAERLVATGEVVRDY